jgi:ferredoxin
VSKGRFAARLETWLLAARPRRVPQNLALSSDALASDARTRTRREEAQAGASEGGIVMVGPASINPTARQTQTLKKCVSECYAATMTRILDQLQALLWLAWSLVVSLLSPLWGGKRGLRDFDASYKKEGFVRMRQADRKLLKTFTGCIACRMCDVVSPGISTMVLAGSRATSDANTQPEFEDAVLARAERVCPTGVPIRRMHAWMRRQAD